MAALPGILRDDVKADDGTHENSDLLYCCFAMPVKRSINNLDCSDMYICLSTCIKAHGTVMITMIEIHRTTPCRCVSGILITL